MLKTKEIIICTTNQGKVAEFQEIFDNLMQVNADLALGLKKQNFSRDSFKTLAHRKSRCRANRYSYGKNALRSVAP
ncbi:MAG: hypothetical protein EBR67_06545 [Proteobacteria bacterium]|nr:hypothetical protein [Pseudomonadota bacterium]